MSKGRLEVERQKRDKYLQRKVQETLCLSPPPQPDRCAHGACPVSSEQLKAQSRAYQEKLRLNRILQVRAQEMLFASKRIAEFRDRKTKDSKMLINHLKEVWSKDQRRRIASLEEEYANACQSIGLSHDAAQLVERNKAAKEELMARQAEEGRYWDTLRFEEAMQKEREQKERRERGESASTLRRKIVESVSSIERSFARRYNCGAKPKPPQEKHEYGCSQSVNPPVTHDTTREKVYTKLAGTPIDFKDTYLHSRFDILQDRTNRPSSAVVNCPEQEEIDAWRAADAQRESNRCERARQIELERLYNERKLERGSAAAAKLLNDQRIALLEQEVEEAFKEEEREQERLHAVTGICKRATMAGQQRRPVYTKHKISNPLSCPDSVSPENDSQERPPENHPVNRKPKSFQDQIELKIGIQGKKIQLADLVSSQAHQQKAVEFSGSTRKSADGRLMHSEGGAEGLILEPGVSKSLPHYPVQTKRKGISPIRASCEEGNVMKQPRVKSPNKCLMPKQNSDGSDRTGKRLFHVGEEAAGPGSRWRSREKERDNESWIKDLAEKASPGKTRYHMELVREAAEVEKEVEEFYKGNKRRPVPQKSPSQRSVENGESQRSQRVENGETQRSQRDASRPPFIASGTIGYKKVLTVPLISRTASRPSSEPAFEKTSSVRESLKPPTKGLDLENLDADEHVSPIRRPSSGINNNGMETSRSWSHPLRPHSGPPKGLKTVISAKCAEHSSDDSGLLNDSAPKRDPASPRNRNKDIRSRFETWNGSAGNGNGSELIFEIGKPKVENARKGNGPEKRVQEPKLRHNAVWKSYMDEKKQNSRKNLETPLTAKSEPSSPQARMERVISSRAKRQTDLQEVGFEQPLVIPNCHTPAASVKSLPISRPRNGRDKFIPRSWKYSQENSKRIEVEASENTSTKTKSLSNRFHSPVTQVLRETSPLRKNRKVVTLHHSGNLAEKAGSARKDGSPSNVADTLLTAWKTGKFQEDYVKAMKRAKEITSGSSSSGISKIFSDRKYTKPWLSRSPFKRSVDGEVNEVSQNQRSVSANPRADYKSPMNRSRNKPSSSRSSPERMVDDLGQSHRSGSAHPKTRNRSPMSRSHATTMLSPKRTNWTSQRLWGPESSKSSPVKIRAGKGETSKDPWEGQSLDFVLGSLAEQVRELDERLRSATVSSPALSSSSSLSREVYGNREQHIPDQPNFRLPDKLNYEDRGSPSSTSATSSPERICVQAARYISRGYTGSQKDFIYKAAKRPASTTYMDELKALLKEISSDNPSPPRRNHVCSNGRRVESESKPHKVQDSARKSESLHKNGIARPKVKAELESDFTSSTSANTSRPCSVASQRNPRETRQRRSPVIGNGRASSRGRVMHDAFHANGNGKLQGERERTSDLVHERRSVPQENGFREDNGIRRVMEKRLVQSGRTQPQVAESVYRDVQERPVQIQQRFEKRTVEVRSCAPQHVLHNGHTVVREQLVKEVVENGLPSPEMNGHDSVRRISDRERKEANGKVTPVKQRRNDEAPQRTLSNGKFASNGNGERGSAQPRGPAAHPISNGHKMITDKRPTQQMQDQTSDYALSNGGEKLKSRQLESPLWGEGSPHCSASWRKGAVNRDEIEDRMLLSGSVDFSPWNTEKLPDIGTPQTARENRTTRSKSPSPIAEDTAGNGSLSPKIQRAKLPPKLNKPFGQRPVRKDAQPNGEVLFHPNPAPVRETIPKSQARPNLKKPKPVPRGIDTIWSVNDQDVALKPSAAQNGVPPTLRKSTPAKKVSPGRTKRRTASVPRARLMKEQTSSSEEVPDSTSKSSHDDNYLPVIMAKDPESRQRVIERRKKALQLDMEHRQRLARNSRPTSARSSG